MTWTQGIGNTHTNHIKESKMDMFLVSDIYGNSDHRGVTLISDNRSLYEVIGKVDGHLFAKSTKTGQLVRVVQTGQILKDACYRAQFEFAHDMNDVDGTVGFSKSDRVGGFVLAFLIK